jgi:hypothetical protein
MLVLQSFNRPAFDKAAIAPARKSGGSLWEGHDKLFEAGDPATKDIPAIPHELDQSPRRVGSVMAAKARLSI